VIKYDEKKETESEKKKRKKIGRKVGQKKPKPRSIKETTLKANG